MFGTRRGQVKRSALTQFVTIRNNGLLAMSVAPDDELAWVRLATDEDSVMFFTQQRSRQFDSISISCGPAAEPAAASAEFRLVERR